MQETLRTCPQPFQSGSKPNQNNKTAAIGKDCRCFYTVLLQQSSSTTQKQEETADISANGLFFLSDSMLSQWICHILLSKKCCQNRLHLFILPLRFAGCCKQECCSTSDKDRKGSVAGLWCCRGTATARRR